MFNIIEICYFVTYLTNIIVFIFNTYSKKKTELKLTKFLETFVFNVKTEVLSVL